MNKKNGVLLMNVKRPDALQNDGAVDCLGLFYLAAALENKGYEPWVFHGLTSDVPEILEKYVKEYKIAAVGFSCDYKNKSAVTELCLYVKEKYEVTVIIGGPQAAALDGKFLSESRCDYIVRGEAEETLPELLDFIVHSKGVPEQIKGLCWLNKSNEFIINDARDPVSELDALPFPAYHRSLRKDRRYGGTIFTGRGCPFACAFCYQSNHKKKVRLRSIANVTQEIKNNLENNDGLKYITVMDDTFTLNSQRVSEFCSAINILRKDRNIGWYCEGHVRTLARQPEMLKSMAESGLLRLQIGVETGCAKVLEAYGKNTTLDEIEFVVREAVRCKVPQIATNFIVGGPFECGEVIDETISFAEKLLNIAPGIIDIATGFLRPYPGTAISNNPAAFGLKISEHDELKSFDDYPPVSVNGLCAEDVINNRVKVSWHISKTMLKILKDNKVPYETILSQYKIAAEYGVTSMWYLNVFKRNQLLNEYFRLICQGSARRLTDVPAGELTSWRPQRTVEIWRIVDIRKGYPQIDDYVLSPLEFELLLHCSGKMTLNEVITSLHEKFGSRFESENEFLEEIKQLLKNFDARYWVVFCKL